MAVATGKFLLHITDTYRLINVGFFILTLVGNIFRLLNYRLLKQTHTHAESSKILGKSVILIVDVFNGQDIKS